MPYAQTKEHAHELIDRMAPGQVAAVVGLMEILLDIAEARAAYARGEAVSNDEVLAEFGLTADDFERMGQTPLEPEHHHPGQ
jgi:hypothetical protein